MGFGEGGRKKRSKPDLDFLLSAVSGVAVWWDKRDESAFVLAQVPLRERRWECV